MLPIMSEIKFNLRKFQPTDLNFILGTWMESYFFFMPSRPPKHIFAKEHSLLINKHLPHCDCLIACAEDDENQILGYIITEKEILHYIYVKGMFRKLGIGSKLMSKLNSEVVHTHYTQPIKHFSHRYKLIYNPYLFYKE
jgi:ribosomal protein S18 acetylase RimI-like enzyme